VSKATALEEMYLIYQAVRNYLADSRALGGVRSGGSDGFLPLLLSAGAYWRDVPGVCAGRVAGPGQGMFLAL
jgi:hypothetical protein